MSFRNRKEREIKKAQYYVWYLGWKEVRGLWGREFTEPITKDLVIKRAHEPLPKLTIEVSKKDIRIVQLVEKKKGKVEKIKYPPIPGKDVTYAIPATSPDEDVVSCIYLGYNPQTRCAVHVHVYRCDSPETAEIFAHHLTQLTEIEENQRRIMKIEADLVAKNQIVPRPTAFVGEAVGDAESTIAPSTLLDEGKYRSGRYEGEEDEADDDDEEYDGRRHATYHNDTPPNEKDVVDVYDSVTLELKAKLQTASALVNPPKDYDTFHRSAGNLPLVEEIRKEAALAINPATLERKFKENGSSHGETASARYSSSDHSYNSRGSRRSQKEYNSDEEYGEDTELQAITPRWKMQSQKYIPPNASDRRGSSDNDDVYNYSAGRKESAKNKSPIYDSRPLSPPPELKKNTYFPSGPNPLPGYMQSPPLSPALRRTRGEAHGGSAHTGSSDDTGSGKKYTASTLGLTDNQIPPGNIIQPAKLRHGGVPRHRDFSPSGHDRQTRPDGAYFYDEAYEPNYATHGPPKYSGGWSYGSPRPVVPGPGYAMPPPDLIGSIPQLSRHPTQHAYNSRRPLSR